MLAPMVDPADIPTLLRRHGRTQADLARHLRLDPSSLTKTIRGARRLKATELVAIDNFFAEAAEERATLQNAKSHAYIAPGGRKIPVYGYAAAGGDRVAVSEGRVIDWMDPPPFWSGAGELIAVRVIGDSMEPRLFEGEVVVAQIDLPPVPGKDCLVEMNDGSAVVKTYLGRRAATLLCRQWNPEGQVDYPTKLVKAVHAILWRR